MGNVYIIPQRVPLSGAAEKGNLYISAHWRGCALNWDPVQVSVSVWRVRPV